MTTALTFPTTIPAIESGDNNLQGYLQQIRKFPMLPAQEELRLAYEWRDEQNLHAAHKLVTSHLRLVAKIAMKYKGYGLPMSEVVSEGNVGLMQAVKKYDPDKGFRLSTYAMWWIRAAIQEYILHSWSLVKIGTTAAQKKLFFNLRKLKGKMDAYEGADLTPKQAESIAKQLSVNVNEVYDMNGRMGMGGDQSLNATIRSDEEGTAQWQDLLVEDGPDQEFRAMAADEQQQRQSQLEAAISTLNEREQDIFRRRRLADEPPTLEQLSGEYGVSRERVRQIEVGAFAKVQTAMVAA